jgi:3-oxoadipate enol-lactonase
MPHIRVNNVNLYYQDTQKGAETIVFAHGLLWSHKLFAAQVEHLKDRYRIIAYDHRGQGQSEVTERGYDIDNLTTDAAELIKALQVGSCHFVGLSMGGFVGMRLAARHPELVTSLTLLETSAQPEPPENAGRYKMLSMVVNLLGIWAVKGPVMKIMFGHTFLNDTHRTAQRKYWEKELLSNRKTITRSVQGVTERKEVADELSTIKCPVLIMAGDQDTATPPEKARFIHEQLPGSKLVIIPGAGHSSTIEEPAFVNKELDNFLSRHSS